MSALIQIGFIIGDDVVLDGIEQDGSTGKRHDGQAFFQELFAKTRRADRLIHE